MIPVAAFKCAVHAIQKQDAHTGKPVLKDLVCHRDTSVLEISACVNAYFVEHSGRFFTQILQVFNWGVVMGCCIHLKPISYGGYGKRK